MDSPRRGRTRTRYDNVQRCLGLCLSNGEFSRRIQDSGKLRGAPRLTYADPHMRNLLLALLHLTIMTAKLRGPGGGRAVLAENLLLKQQLIV